MKIRPLNDRVLVLRTDQEEKTKGGIIIPDTAKEKPQEVKEGDRVLFGKYSGSEIKVDGVEHLIMREDDILAIIEK
jgi:chaperonin GroES